MFASMIDKTINVSPDIARAFTGVVKGYRVQLHALPDFTFNVEADSVDHAQRIVVELCRSEGKHIAQTGATVQRIAN